MTVVIKWKVFCIVLWIVCMGEAIEKRCGRSGRGPNNILHLDSNDYAIGEEVTYFCKNGQISVPKRRVCGPNGKWSGNVPICYETADCNNTLLPSPLSNESPSWDTLRPVNYFLRTTLVKPAVIAGIRLILSSRDQVHIEVVVMKESGDEMICGTFFGNVGNESSKDLLCGTDIKVKSVTLRNIENSSYYLQHCEVKVLLRSDVLPCLLPDIPFNGYGNTRYSRDKINFNYYCKEGYDLRGSSLTTCSWNGIWTPEAPVCVAKWCSEASREPIANGELLVNSTEIHSIALLSCREGYRPLSDDRIQCLPTGLWSHASLICAPVRCEANPDIPHGSSLLLDNSTFYGSRLQVVCSKGYFSKEPVIRMCERSGTWGQLHGVCIEISCDMEETTDIERGQWLPFNESRSVSWGALRVLSCNHGYHIHGSPVVVQCLANGSWSYTTATCRKTPEAEGWTSEWSPSVMMMAAVAVGAGTAISILCLVTTYLVLRKRHQAKSNTTVFHVSLSDIPKGCAAAKSSSNTTENHYYTTPMYEEVTEFSLARPRKPSSALPCLPPDADPVYAQPFETYPKETSKVNQSECYGSHIYTEPVDSKELQPSSPFGTGVLTNFPMKGRPFIVGQSLKDNVSSSWNIQLDSQGHAASKFGTNTEMGTMHRCNSIYLQSRDEDFPLSKHMETVQIIDNDLYVDKYFSNA